VPKEHEASPTKVNSKPEEGQRVVPPTHVVIDPPIPSPSESPKPSGDKDVTAEQPLPRFVRPEWIIAYITAAYVFITWLMMRTIKRQADAMDRQAIEARKSGNDAAALATGMLAAIREQAALMRQQVDTMERQLGIAETSAKAAEDNATAAHIAADAAKMSAKIAKDSLELTQRAFIQVVSMGLNRGRIPLADDVPVTDDASVLLSIKNHGPTRALNVTVKGTLTITPGNKSTAVAPQISYDLPPATDLAIAFDAFNSWLDADAIALLKQGKANLQVSLKITYADVFGVPHEIAIEAALHDWIRRVWDIKVHST